MILIEPRQIRRLFLLILAGAMVFGRISLPAAEFKPPLCSFKPPATLQLAHRSFNLADHRDLSQAAALARQLADTCADHEKRLARQQRVLRGKIQDLPAAQLKSFFSQSSPKPFKRFQLAFRHLAHLAQSASALSPGPERDQLVYQIGQLALALQNNSRNPAPAYVDALTMPFLLLDYLSNPIAAGRRPAANIPPAQPGQCTDQIDPPSSTFWSQPQPIASQDLYAGFGRARLPDYTNQVWSYRNPKLHGWNPGCELQSGPYRIDIKFGDLHAEPFAARIFHALGFNVDPTDYVSSLKIKYDRRFFRELNLRRDITTRFGLFHIPVGTIRIKRHVDPFDFIQGALLTNGSQISGHHLKSILLKNPKRPGATDDPNNFHTHIEKQLDYLITVPANVQPDQEELLTIGPWSFDQLDHRHRRELRGAGLLAAWIGWWDVRFENTRLRLRPSTSSPQLVHYFSDLGGGLGISRGTFRHATEVPARFDSAFTRVEEFRSNRLIHSRFRITNYEPIDDVPPFTEMTPSDARWMARRIAQLSNEQISQALTASGFNKPDTLLLTGKLASRRDRLLQDLGLTTPSL